MPGNRILRLNIFSAALALLLGWTGPVIAADTPSGVEVGVFPYLSTRALLDVYEPVRVYLQAELNRPTNLFTATSFKAYADRTQAGEYDVVLTPPHLARLAQREAGYIPLTMYTRELRGVVVVAKASPIQTLQDLKGKRVATPNKIALVSIVGSQLLRDNGLVNDANISIHDVGSHSNAVLAVQRNEAEAAITENAALQQMPDALRNSVRLIAQTQRLPHVMFLAHPRLGQAGVARVRELLLQFANTTEGRAFLKSNGFEGMRPVDEADMKSIDPLIKELKRILETMPP
ncbi:MAG: phosphate/phosphite/phosphonate ABC transporter substrate-binding protein [Pseudomonadota bacterium]